MRVELSEEEVCEIRSLIVFRLFYCKELSCCDDKMESDYWKDQTDDAQTILNDFDAKTKAPASTYMPDTGYADELGGWKAHEDDRIQ